MDRFTKVCLVLITLLLTVIAVRPMMFPQAVAAQFQRYKYVAVRAVDWQRPQPELDKYAADGWELAGTYVANINNNDQAILIFRK
jgi:hypothetical protein